MLRDMTFGGTFTGTRYTLRQVLEELILIIYALSLASLLCVVVSTIWRL